MSDISEMEIKAMTKEQNYICGYKNGKSDVLDKIRAEIEQLPTKTMTNWNGCCPDIDYPEIEYVTKNKLLNIIDKYKAESDGNADG